MISSPQEPVSGEAWIEQTLHGVRVVVVSDPVDLAASWADALRGVGAWAKAISRAGADGAWARARATAEVLVVVDTGASLAEAVCERIAEAGTGAAVVVFARPGDLDREADLLEHGADGVVTPLALQPTTRSLASVAAVVRRLGCLRQAVRATPVL